MGIESKVTLDTAKEGKRSRQRKRKGDLQQEEEGCRKTFRARDLVSPIIPGLQRGEGRSRPIKSKGREKKKKSFHPAGGGWFNALFCPQPKEGREEVLNEEGPADTKNHTRKGAT